jgi:hypothetical protein
MTFAQIRQYVTGLLRASFTNKAELDKIGEDESGNLTYNGSAINAVSETITSQDIADAIDEDVDDIWADPAEEEPNGNEEQQETP